ncbi:MAG: hypothetical protein NC048_02560 [Bacteroides sp.]|nr:hypothetical protein [Bacteroides sp.]MCM1531479.1 hypothetical protein [Ruminococcus flavefaciens]MCM1554359.1 hypothetical protein [Bacteroides sp.]
MEEFGQQFDINKKFDEELDMQIKGDLPSNHVYELGRPCAILKSTGVPDLPIQLSAKRLLDKATLFGHDFDLVEIKGLVNRLNSPVAVFAYGDPKKAQNVILELKQNNKHFLVGLALNPEIQGRKLEVNSIRNIFPKEDTEWVNWIGQGKALYLNQKEIQVLIDQLQTIPADVNYLNLDFVANVVKNFENPKMEEEIKQEDNVYETRYENGQLKRRVHYNSSGERDGLYEHWYENGQMSTRYNLKDGKLEGLCESWHMNGQRETRRNYKNGNPDGLSESWYRTGQMYLRENYKNRQLDGLREMWHRNGKPAARAYYKDDMMHGLYEEWDPNGKLTERAVYREGKRIPCAKKQEVAPNGKRSLGL